MRKQKEAQETSCSSSRKFVKSSYKSVEFGSCLNDLTQRTGYAYTQHPDFFSLSKPLGFVEGSTRITLSLCLSTLSLSILSFRSTRIDEMALNSFSTPELTNQYRLQINKTS